jgi:thiol-disulfide isomerase/thioredoxin
MLARGSFFPFTLIGVFIAGLAAAGPQTRAAAESRVSEEQAAFYRRAFPEATQFRIKRVPSEMLPVEDQGNETYVEARNARNMLLGYLRDFVGPISASPVCPCSPLSLTLVFGPDLTFRTLISQAPLEKYGHEAMTPAETERLIQIVKAPAPQLMRAARVEDLVDAVSGATRSEYQRAVVTQAALTSRRVAGLARDTVRLIRGAPLARDQVAYQRMVGSETDPAVLAGKLAEFLPQAESPEALSQGYEALFVYYARGLKRRPVRQPAVEQQILARLDRSAAEVARACQYLAADGLAVPFVQDCIRRLEPRSAALDQAEWALLQGTVAFESGRPAEAIEPLRRAATGIDHNQDPGLHSRLVKALQSAGQMAEACRRVKPLFRDQPRYPGAESLLAVCGEPAGELAGKLHQERRALVLASRRADNRPAPALAVADGSGRAQQIDLSTEGKVTVLIFFATWCPHCQESFPEFKAFASALQQGAFRGQARLVSVRTFAERDQEPYAAFAQRFQPNFPVWHDGPQGKNFRQWASLYSFPSSIPRLLVLDRKGVLRFVVDTSGYRDFMEELGWATEALVAEP